MNLDWRTLESTVVQPVGWMLLHSVWQIAGLATVFALLSQMMQRSSSQLRYCVAAVMLAAAALLPIVTFVSLAADPSHVWDVPATASEPGQSPLVAGGAAEELEATLAEVTTTAATIEPQGIQSAPPASDAVPAHADPWLSPYLNWAAATWAVCVLAISVWNLGGWIAVQRMARLGTRAVAPSIERSFVQLAKKLRVSRRVRIFESLLVEAPSLVGWLKPVILLPASAIAGLTPEQLEMVLAHELAHVRRLDYLANLLQTVVETLFFYHPGVHYLSRRMRIEREYCADQLAIAVTGDRVEYAKALAEVGANVSAGPQFALAATDGSLSNRVKRLFGLKTSDGGRTGSWLVGAGASLVCLLGLIAGPAVRASLALGETPEITLRRIWADQDTDAAGRISPDGRYIAYTNWDTGDLSVRDMESGESRALTSEGGWSATSKWAEQPIWSKDSKRIAYAWYEGEKQDLRIVSVDAGEPQVLVEGESDVAFAYPLDWTPDATRILAGGMQNDGQPYVALFSVDDGLMERLPVAWADWDAASISPDGTYVALDRQSDGAERDIYLYEFATGETRQLIFHPADDRAPLWTLDGKWLTFASTRSGDKQPWMIPFAEGKPAGAPRRVAPALVIEQPLGLTRKGAYVAVCNARTSNVYEASYDPDGGTISGKPELLVRRFEGTNSLPVWSPDGTKLAYISSRPASGGGSCSMIVVRDEASGREVFRLSETQVRPLCTDLRWRHDNRTLVINALLSGEDDWPNTRHELLLVDIETGGVSTLARWPLDDSERPSFALAVSPDDAYVYYAQQKGPAARVIRRRINGGQSSTIGILPESVAPQSFAISPDGQMLAVADRSTICLVDLRSQVARIRYTVATGGPSLLTGIDWTPDGNRLLFAQRDRGEPSQSVMLSLAESESAPREIGLRMPELAHTQLHVQGRRIAFTGSDAGHWNEVWMVEHSDLLQR